MKHTATLVAALRHIYPFIIASAPVAKHFAELCVRGRIVCHLSSSAVRVESLLWLAYGAMVCCSGMDKTKPNEMLVIVDASQKYMLVHCSVLLDKRIAHYAYQQRQKLDIN